MTNRLSTFYPSYSNKDMLRLAWIVIQKHQLLRSCLFYFLFHFFLFLFEATRIEELKQKVAELTETKDQLEHRNHELAEESTYAKGLASAAAVELKALSEEVAKLMNHNERLSAELAAQKNSPTHRRNSSTLRNGRRDSHVRRQDQSGLPSDLKRELALSRERGFIQSSVVRNESKKS